MLFIQKFQDDGSDAGNVQNDDQVAAPFGSCIDGEVDKAGRTCLLDALEVLTNESVDPIKHFLLQHVARERRDVHRSLDGLPLWRRDVNEGVAMVGIQLDEGLYVGRFLQHILKTAGCATIISICEEFALAVDEMLGGFDDKRFVLRGEVGDDREALSVS